MKKSKALRLAGFAGALCASGALLGTSISGTGAYFTDAHSGEIDAGTGHVRVVLDPADGKLHFDNLLPGEFKTDRISYTAQGTGAEDIWLVLPKSGSEAFTSTPQAGPSPLGRYGHFAVSSSGGASFSSYNLALDPANGGTYNTTQSCSIDANGEGGSNQQATDKNDHSVPYCAPANAILLQSNMNNGDQGYADLTFGYTKLLTAPQDAPDTKVVSYQIVATQHGVRPDDPNNG